MQRILGYQNSWCYADDESSDVFLQIPPVLKYNAKIKHVFTYSKIFDKSSDNWDRQQGRASTSPQISTKRRILASRSFLRCWCYSSRQDSTVANFISNQVATSIGILATTSIFYYGIELCFVSEIYAVSDKK